MKSLIFFYHFPSAQNYIHRHLYGADMSSFTNSPVFRIFAHFSFQCHHMSIYTSLGRPQGAVTLLRGCEWWRYVWAWSTRRGLKPKFYRLPRPWSLWGSSPARENSHIKTGNRTRNLMLSSQKLWPPSHETGLMLILTLSLLMYIYGAPCKARNFNVVCTYGPTFGNAESRLFLFAAQCFNTESMQKVILWHSCV
jgi:hypothetical protein